MDEAPPLLTVPPVELERPPVELAAEVPPVALPPVEVVALLLPPEAVAVVVVAFVDVPPAEVPPALVAGEEPPELALLEELCVLPPWLDVLDFWLPPLALLDEFALLPPEAFVEPPAASGGTNESPVSLLQATMNPAVVITAAEKPTIPNCRTSCIEALLIK
jgi:hypothetical protein